MAENLTKNFNMKKFKISRILFNDATRKTIGLLGTFPYLSKEDQAIVIFEKLAFTDDSFKTNESEKVEDETTSFLSTVQDLKEIFKNDIYGNHFCYLDPELNYLKTTTVYPATEKHINKYSKQELFLVQETPELYADLTLKHLKNEQFSLEWLYNILDHKKEQDRIAFEDKDPEIGFVLLPDLKWDGVTKEQLYLQAIIQKRDIKSLRDLNGSHLQLLTNIREKSLQAIHQKYGVSKFHIRAYLHYQPSFYHLHVHFTYLKYDAPGIFCEKSHLLDHVINNIQMIPDYYQKATLSFVLKDNDRLFKMYEDIIKDECNKKLRIE